MAAKRRQRFGGLKRSFVVTFSTVAVSGCSAVHSGNEPGNAGSAGQGGAAGTVSGGAGGAGGVGGAAGVGAINPPPPEPTCPDDVPAERASCDPPAEPCTYPLPYEPCLPSDHVSAVCENHQWVVSHIVTACNPPEIEDAGTQMIDDEDGGG